jgi:hypothetical protein
MPTDTDKEGAVPAIPNEQELAEDVLHLKNTGHLLPAIKKTARERGLSEEQLGAALTKANEIAEDADIGKHDPGFALLARDPDPVRRRARQQHYCQIVDALARAIVDGEASVARQLLLDKAALLDLVPGKNESREGPSVTVNMQAIILQAREKLERFKNGQ